MTGEVLKEYVGRTVTLYCVNYFYSGPLVDVRDGCAILNPAIIIYNTGDHGAKDWSCARPFPEQWCVSLDAVESFGYFKG